VTLLVEHSERTIELLTESLGFSRVGGEEGRTRFAAGGAVPGALVDVSDGTGFPEGRTGVGTVDHVAFRVSSEDELLGMREEIERLGYEVTPVRERHYFRSIYFREPGGVLFEIATEVPGFTVDEDLDSLGNGLSLPPFLENQREQIERNLKPIQPTGYGVS
jgi:glyoxalase family protein